MGADLVSRNLHKSLSINELWRRGGRKAISPSFLKTYNNNQTKENPRRERPYGRTVLAFNIRKV